MRKAKPPLILIAVLIVLFAGRTTAADEGTSIPASRDLGQVGLTLREALTRTLKFSPQLLESSWRKKAAAAREIQAGLLPNPELEFEMEEFGGTELRNGMEAAVTSLQVAQLIELGGKRGSRVRRAAAMSLLSGWDYESARLDLLSETAVYFYEVLAAQEKLAVSDEMVGLARRMHEVIGRRVDAGKVSPLELSKSRVFLTTATIGRERTARGLDTARRKLASMWLGEPDFEAVAGDLYRLQDLPAEAETLKSMELNPDLARWHDELTAAETAARLEEAIAFPDLKLSAGFQRFNEIGETAFRVGFTFDIPLFDRNQGGVLAARSQLKVKTYQRVAKEKTLGTELAAARNDYESYRTAAVSLRDVVLPAADEAYRAAREGYERGKLGYLEVLDAQRTLTEVKFDYIETLRAYQLTLMNLERLTGLLGLDVAVDSDAPEGETK